MKQLEKSAKKAHEREEELLTKLKLPCYRRLDSRPLLSDK